MNVCFLIWFKSVFSNITTLIPLPHYLLECLICTEKLFQTFGSIFNSTIPKPIAKCNCTSLICTWLKVWVTFVSMKLSHNILVWLPMFSQISFTLIKCKIIICLVTVCSTFTFVHQLLSYSYLVLISQFTNLNQRFIELNL